VGVNRERHAIFSTFPEDARWNAGRQAVEFGVEIGEYSGVVRAPRSVIQRLLPERPIPERYEPGFESAPSTAPRMTPHKVSVFTAEQSR